MCGKNAARASPSNPGGNLLATLNPSDNATNAPATPSNPIALARISLGVEEEWEGRGTAAFSACGCNFGGGFGGAKTSSRFKKFVLGAVSAGAGSAIVFSLPLPFSLGFSFPFPLASDGIALAVGSAGGVVCVLDGA